jgi:NAD-dependent dihydropyrimidine dehydrogenase PreA subunit
MNAKTSIQQCNDFVIKFANVNGSGSASANDLFARVNAPASNLTQDLYVSTELKSGRIMVKDEDVCLHCGLCAERCPTGAWDMQKFLLNMTQAGPTCRDPRDVSATGINQAEAA